MGRWAQARRRQSVLPLAGPSGPPPAPTLDATSGDLLQTATGSDDTGGTCELEYALAVGGPFEKVDQSYWEAVNNWGDNGSLQGYYYRCREVGNGVAYVGASEYSNVVNLTV